MSQYDFDAHTNNLYNNSSISSDHDLTPPKIINSISNLPNYQKSNLNLKYSNPITKYTPSLNHYILDSNLSQRPEKISEHQNFKKENSFSHNNRSQANMEVEEFSNLSQDITGNKLRLQLMEKDKIIIEYTKIVKESERQLDHSKKINFSKDEVISNLKDENKNLKFKLKNSEIILQNKNDEFEKFRTFAEEKIFELNKEKSNIEEKFEGISKIYENNKMEFQNTLIEYKKMEKQLLKLNKNFLEKNDQISNLEKFQEDIKRENKNIPMLKKQIGDMEKTITDLKNEIELEMSKRKKVLKEKEEIEKKFKELIEENKSEKEANMKIIKMSYEIENLKKENEEKSKENEKLNEKNKLTVKENDSFVQLFTNELNELTNILENFGNYKNFGDLNYLGKNLNSNNQYALQKSIFKSKNNLSNSSHLNFKFELVNKNLEVLKNKIFENLNDFTNFISKKEKKEIESETQLKELSNQRTNLLKEISLNKQKLNEMSERNSEMESNYEKLFEDFKMLKEKFVQVRTNNEEEKKRNENICKEVYLFLETCFNKLKEKFPEAENNLHNFGQPHTSLNENKNLLENSNKNFKLIPLDFSEKLIYLLDVLIKENKNLFTTEKELYELIKQNQIEMKKLQDEKETLMIKLDSVLSAKEEDYKNSEFLKNEELKRQREILYEKISSLTNLLEESNAMISLYENENKELKEKLSKLEYNLKMLTKSHVELE